MHRGRKVGVRGGASAAAAHRCGATASIVTGLRRLGPIAGACRFEAITGSQIGARRFVGRRPGTRHANETLDSLSSAASSRRKRRRSRPPSVGCSASRLSRRLFVANSRCEGSGTSGRRAIGCRRRRGPLAFRVAGARFAASRPRGGLAAVPVGSIGPNCLAAAEAVACRRGQRICQISTNGPFDHHGFRDRVAANGRFPARSERGFGDNAAPRGPHTDQGCATTTSCANSHTASQAISIAFPKLVSGSGLTR